MIAGDVALILLAAGEARRFGGDKLMAELNGKPLAAHAVAALAPIGFRRRIAVVSRTGFDFAASGYQVVRNERPEDGLSGSLRLGLSAAGECTAVLIALADMPRVRSSLVERLLQATDGREAVVAATDGRRPSPPAVIGAAHFAVLRSLTGDSGARDLLRFGLHIHAAPGELVDVDTPAALHALQQASGRVVDSSLSDQI